MAKINEVFDLPYYSNKLNDPKLANLILLSLINSDLDHVDWSSVHLNLVIIVWVLNFFLVVKLLYWLLVWWSKIRCDEGQSNGDSENCLYREKNERHFLRFFARTFLSRCGVGRVLLLFKVDLKFFLLSFCDWAACMMPTLLLFLGFEIRT